MSTVSTTPDNRRLVNNMHTTQTKATATVTLFLVLTSTMYWLQSWVSMLDSSEWQHYSTMQQAATHLNCRHLLISFSKWAISYNKFCSFRWCWSIFSFAYKMIKGLLKFTQWRDNLQYTTVWQGNSFIAAASHGYTIQPQISDRTWTVPGLVPDQNKVDSVRSRNIFCSGAGPC